MGRRAIRSQKPTAVERFPNSTHSPNAYNNPHTGALSILQGHVYNNMRTEDQVRRLNVPASPASTHPSPPPPKVKQDGLAKLNALPVADLNAELLRICGSRVWVEAVAKTFPHTSPASVLTAMEKVWWSLSKPDYLEAFSAHPRIGDAAALKKVSSQHGNAASW